MKEEVKHSLRKCRDALTRLQQGIQSAKDELDQDGVIQRFEFTVELFWKMLKVTLAEQGIECKTPRESLKGAFRVGWLKEEDVFLAMLEDRNKTSHLYSHEESRKIFDRIQNQYQPAMKRVLTQLQFKDG